MKFVMYVCLRANERLGRKEMRERRGEEEHRTYQLAPEELPLLL